VNRKIAQSTLTETASKGKTLPLIDARQATVILSGICDGLLTRFDDAGCFSCDTRIAMKSWTIIV
jgi:hypothetical protein